MEKVLRSDDAKKVRHESSVEGRQEQVIFRETSDGIEKGVGIRVFDDLHGTDDVEFFIQTFGTAEKKPRLGRSFQSRSYRLP